MNIFLNKKEINDHELSELYLVKGEYDIKYEENEIESVNFYKVEEINNLIENDKKLFTNWFIKFWKVFNYKYLKKFF
jgi:isopentenyldiphosphate isomerase